MFVGTLWPVRSDSALLYVDTFYECLVAQGQNLGEASLHARRAIRDQGSDPTWLAYTVYGQPGSPRHLPLMPALSVPHRQAAVGVRIKGPRDGRVSTTAHGRRGSEPLELWQHTEMAKPTLPGSLSV